MCSTPIYHAIHIISRKIAKELGMKTYFTGIPCPNGHFSERFVSNFGCHGCLKDREHKRHMITKEKTREKREKSYLEKFFISHGDRYDYSKFRYIEAKEKSSIICRIHGVFKQTPDKHARGNGCPKCKIKILQDHNTKTTESFIKDAKEIHGDTYGYKDTIYSSWTEKLEVECYTHGSYFITPESHLSYKRGCQLCLNDGKNELKRDSFIQRSNEVHNNFYSYEKMKYTPNNEKILITCPDHGDFYQQKGNHLSGKGCSKCSKRKTVLSEIMGMGEEEKNSDYFLYHVRFKKDGVTFDKIGVTKFENVVNRFSRKEDMDIFFKVISVKKGRKEDILIDEMNILTEMENGGNRYRLSWLLKGNFCGWSECFFIEDYNPIEWFGDMGGDPIS